MSQYLQELEDDLAATRARLARNLGTLRSPAARSEFSDAIKHEVLAAKDDLVERTRSAAQERVQDWVDALKARAANNPAAVLAIAAGIGWRVLRNPPIATALVGVGMWHLFRGGAPSRTGRREDEYLNLATARLRQQSSEFATGLADQARAAAIKAGQRAEDWREEADAVLREGGAAMVDQAVATTAAATRQTEAAAARVRDAASRAASELRIAASDAAERVSERTDRFAEAAHRRADDPPVGATERFGSPELEHGKPGGELADTLLLGAAGAAVAAAFGIALQRRIFEPHSAE